jgi:non-ribosomal peptide synthetase component F
VRETTLEAFANQDLPFARLVSALNPPRELGRGPLFDVKLVLQNAPAPRVATHGLELERMDLGLATSKFDLLVNLWEEGSELAGEVSYRTDLFEERRVRELVRDLDLVLQRFVLDPDIRVEAVGALLREGAREEREIRQRERRKGNVERLRGLRRPALEPAIGEENRT